MIELLVIGRLGEARHFPRHVVEPAMIAPLHLNEYVIEDYWKELVPPLAAIGRSDLVEAIRAKMEQAGRQRLWASDAGWKGRLRRFDRRFLGGRLMAARRQLS